MGGVERLNVVLPLSPPQHKFFRFTASTCSTAKTTLLVLTQFLFSPFDICCVWGGGGCWIVPWSAP